MTLKLKGTSGSVSLDAPTNTTSGADVVLTFPVDDGDANQVLQTDGSGALSWENSAAWESKYTSEQTLDTSTNSLTIAGIPADAKQVIFTFWHLSANAASNNMRLELGTSSSLITSGYRSQGSYMYNGQTAMTSNMQSAFIPIPHIDFDGAANNYDGFIHFVKHAAHKWLWSGYAMHEATATHVTTIKGSLDLGAALSQIKLYTSGTANFDLGSVNAHWIK